MRVPRRPLRVPRPGRRWLSHSLGRVPAKSHDGYAGLIRLYAAPSGRGGGSGPLTASRTRLATSDGVLDEVQPEFPDQTVAAVNVPHDVVERGDEPLQLLVAHQQGREELDDVDVVAGHLGEDPMPVEQGRHHELGEQAATGRSEQLPRRPVPKTAGRPELDADHEATPPDVGHEVV